MNICLTCKHADIADKKRTINGKYATVTQWGKWNVVCKNKGMTISIEGCHWVCSGYESDVNLIKQGVDDQIGENDEQIKVG